MASGVGTIVGSAIGGPVGGLIGGALGALVDRSLFGTGRERAPSLTELSFTTGSEGNPILYAIGPENRIPCSVLWTSPVSATTTEQGGKGGGGGVSSNSFSVDVCLGICEGPITSVDQIYAAGKLIYDSTPDVTTTSDQISLTVVIINQTSNFIQIEVELDSPIGGPDLSELRIGRDVTMSGWSNSNNNFTGRVNGTVYNGDTSSTARVYWGGYFGSTDTTVHPVDESSGTSVTLTQDNPTFPTTAMDGITIYLGTDTDAVDPLIEAVEGAGNVPAYRGIAHVVIEGLQLGSYPTLPNIQAVVKGTASPTTMATALSSWCARVGLESSQYSTSAVSGNLRGYVSPGPVTGQDAVSPLLLANDTRVQDNQGVLTFTDYADLTAVTIDAADLAAHEDGGEAARVATWRVGSTPPVEVAVRHIDPSNKYQLGSQRSRWRSTKTNRFRDSVMELDIQAVMTASEARDIAERVRLTLDRNAREATIQLPPGSGTTILEGDLVTFTDNGETYTITATKVTTGHNWITVVTGVREEATAHAISGSNADTSTNGDGGLDYPTPLLAIGSDIAPMRDLDATTAGYYWGACALDRTAEFNGGELHVSVDGGTSFTYTDPIPTETILGYTVSTLASGVTNVWDTTSTVDVKLLHGSLSSATAAQVLTGVNWLFIGSEVIGFQTATLTATNTYRLSNLLRGARGTENFVATHGATEYVVYASATEIAGFNPVPISNVGDTFFLKGVPYAGDPDDAAESALELTGGTITPFAPYDIAGVRDVSNNLSISWKPRTRALVGIWTDVSVPLLEEFEEYEIDFLNGSSTVVRTVTITGSTSTSYTAAQQTSDGLTPGDPVDGNIYQISSRGIGRGRVAAFTV